MMLAAATAIHLSLGVYVTVSPYACGNVGGGCPVIKGFALLRSVAAFPASVVIAIFPSTAKIDVVRSDFFWTFVVIHSFAAVCISYGFLRLVAYLGRIMFRPRY